MTVGYVSWSCIYGTQLPRCVSRPVYAATRLTINRWARRFYIWTFPRTLQALIATVKCLQHVTSSVPLPPLPNSSDMPKYSPAALIVQYVLSYFAEKFVQIFHHVTQGNISTPLQRLEVKKTTG